VKKKNRIILSVGVLAGLAGTVFYEEKKRKRLDQIEQIVGGLLASQNAMLSYQEKVNQDVQDQFDQVVDEMGSVYDHLEALSESKKE